MIKTLRTALVAAALTVATVAIAADGARHPQQYVVQKGDTLWDISARFLGKPWFWPEIWQANPQVNNPHLIYPGDVLSLAYTDRLALTPGPRTLQPIPAIDLEDVRPFLKNMLVLDSFEDLPRVVGLEEDRLRAGTDQEVYTAGLEHAQVGEQFAVMRPVARFSRTTDGRLTTYAEDLDESGRRYRTKTLEWDRMDSSGRVGRERGQALLGYELRQVGLGTVKRAGSGHPYTGILTLEEGHFEVRKNDRLVPVDTAPYDAQFFPHPPKVELPRGHAQVMAVADGFLTGGTRDVVAISAGGLDGVDNGTVFSIWRPGSNVTDRLYDPEDSRTTESRMRGRDLVMPDEAVAHVMVFRTFDKVSYGLVMKSSREVQTGYLLRHPDATE